MSEPSELDALAGEAQQVDFLIAPVAVENLETPATPEALPVDRLAEASMLVGIVRPMAVMALPCIKDSPDSEWTALHQPIADLLAFYNVDVSKYLSSPWAALAFASVPLVMRGVNNWKATKAETEKTPAPGEPTKAEPEKLLTEPVFAARG